MSTVFYAVKLPKDRVLPFAASLRAFFLANNDMVTLHQNVLEELEAASGDDDRQRYILKKFHKGHSERFLTYRKNKAELKQNWEVNLRLVHIGRYAYVVVREPDYTYFPRRDQFEGTPIDYDNRTDIPAEHRKNRRIADKYFDLVRELQYFEVPILTEQDYFYFQTNWDSENPHPIMAWAKANEERLGTVDDGDWTPQEQAWEDELTAKNDAWIRRNFPFLKQDSLVGVGAETFGASAALIEEIKTGGEEVKVL